MVMVMNFIKHSKLYFLIAIVAVALSAYSLFSFGLNLGIDFEGGSMITINYSSERPQLDEIRNSLLEIEEASGMQAQPLGEDEIILKIKEQDISSETFSKIINALPGEFDTSIETISPVVGKELKDKTLIVVLSSLLAMLAYIALAFNSVSKPISSIQYGISSTLTLFHDLIIPLGVLAFLGYYYDDVQINIPIITALLAIVGYSINNNIVIFDRIRENLKRENKLSYSEIVNKSLNETFIRCLNTSFTVLLVLIPLYYFFTNEESLKYFTFIMGIGIFVGFFSSIFLSSPLLVAWNNHKNKKK